MDTVNIPLTKEEQDRWLEWAGVSKPENYRDTVIMLFGISYLAARKDQMTKQEFSELIDGFSGFLKDKHKIQEESNGKEI